MFTIKTLNAISPVGLAKLNKNLFDVSVDTDVPDGILVRSADLLNTTFNDNLLAIARAGAGVNNIPLDRCSERNLSDWSSIKVQVKETLGKFLMEKTGRRPMILPIIMEV